MANDALTVVVNQENTWASCLSVDQLKAMWEPGSTVNNWNQVDPSFPDEPLTLFGARGLGHLRLLHRCDRRRRRRVRTDYSPTEDDNVTVQGVQGSKGALGYFGFSYFEENQATLKAVQIDGGQGCVAW